MSEVFTETATEADLSAPLYSGGAMVESRQPAAPERAEGHLLAVITRAALDPRVDMDKFERLLAAQEKLEARSAQIAFNAAMAAAKSEIEPVVRNTVGHNSKKFADLSAIARGVDHILGRHGLSYRFRTSQPGPISVTCILSHKDGHSEENTLSGPPDKTGNKNEVQAIGSTQTYLMRYTLMGALGLAATEEDDGRAVGRAQAGITDEQAAELRRLIDVTKTDEAKLLEGYKRERIEDLSPVQFGEARVLLEQKARKLAKQTGGATDAR